MAIRKINESSQEVVTSRNENKCTIYDHSMSNLNTNDQNDQSVTNEIESHHIFFYNEQQDLESDNEINEINFLSELPKIFEEDEKFWRWYKWKQKLLGHGIVPIIRMAEELKNKSPDSKKLKTYISDSLTVFLNAFLKSQLIEDS